MFIPGSRIQQQQKRGRGKNLYSYFFCDLKFHKIDNDFILEQVGTEKFESIDKKFKYRTFYLEIVN
jgi:hypothetical protein